MSLAYIRKTYAVPAKRGGRVEYTACRVPQFGTITGASGAHLNIRIDGDKRARRFHPTWKLRYLDTPAGRRAIAQERG